MEIYLDLEKTLLNEEKKLSLKTFNALKMLSKAHKITILTSSCISEVKAILPLADIRIVSTIENKLYENGAYLYDSFDSSSLSSILDFPYIYTLYTIKEDTTYILKYQERMKNFYPNQSLKICSQFPSKISSFVIAIFKEGLDEFKELVKNCALDVLAEDSKKVLMLITPSISTKESWLLKLKESPEIGIGDSSIDYEFIKYCKIQVAMKNGDEALKAKCKYQTSKTNQEDGAIDFILDYLKHQQA